MCLTAKQYFKTKKATLEAGKGTLAKEDIIVYKALSKRTDGTIMTPYQNFPFEKGNEYYQDDRKLGARARKVSVSPITWKLVIHSGLHACTTKEEAQRKYRADIVAEMIIPKGARYVIGNDEDIVSTRLIWY